MPGSRRTWRDRVPHPLWVGMAVGAVVGAVLALGVVALVGGTDDPLEPGELVILSGQDDSPGGQRQALIGLWNALNPTHPARIQVLNQGSNAQHDEMVNQARAKTAVDIYNLDVTWTAEFADEGYLRAPDMSRLPRPLLDGYLQKPLATCRYHGTLWALPFNTDAGLIFYRSDLVQAPRTGPGGLPRFDWKAMTDAAGQLSTLRAREPRLLAGYTSQLSDYEGLTVNGLEALWAAHVDAVDDDGKVSFNQDTWKKGLAPLAIAPKPGIVQPDATTYDESLSRAAFGDGRVLFMRNWPIAYRALKGTDGAGKSSSVPFDVALLPGPSALGGQNLAIASTTKRPRAAQALIQFLTGEPSQRLLFERGGFAPSQSAVYNNAAVQQDNPYVTLLRAAIEEARLRPVTRYYVEFSTVFQNGVHDALLHDGTVSPGLGGKLADALHGR